MMAELRAGGIAMVYGLRVDTEDNGLIVRTECYVAEGGSFVNPITGEYEQYYGLGDAWLCTGDIEFNGYGFYDPRNLMPIDNTDPDVVSIPTCDTDKVVFHGD